MLKQFIKSSFAMSIAAGLLGAYLRLVDWTTRKEVIGLEKVNKVLTDGSGVIVLFWHGRLPLSPFVRNQTEKDVYMLVSRHRDGDLISRGVKDFNLKFIRGSSANVNKPGKAKHGAHAAGQIISALKENAIIAITPDGPRGPAEIVQQGPARLALQTGAPLLAMGMSTSHGCTLSSWDRMVIPLPFSRQIFVFSDPAPIPQGKDQIEPARLDIQSKLLNVTARADTLAGRNNYSGVEQQT